MEPAADTAIREEWSTHAEVFDMDRCYETLCRTHPAYRDPALERRSELRRKQQELGDKYPRYFYMRFMSIEEFVGVVGYTNSNFQEIPDEHQRPVRQ